MIAVYCFCLKDQDLALRNARWWNELGGCKGHELLVCYDPRCDPGVVELVRQEMEKCFDKIWRLNKVAEVDGWPEGANYFFRLCCTWLQDQPQWPCFFWMEPDAVPLRPGWMDAIAQEYKRGGKLFMGDRVEVGDIPLHMSGVGVYENPIYLHAGEAYRAHDLAFDMAAREQIIPHAFFTELIEHAWKHPAFHELSELDTQIAKETILFHSSKDGSLIDLLQQQRRGKHPASASNSVLPEKKEWEEPRSPSPLPVYDILIRTYPGDYEWLFYCLKSIQRYVRGFRKIWVVSPGAPPEWFPERIDMALNASPSLSVAAAVTWKQMNDETEDGYLAQQITKLYADTVTDYQADYYLHVDSDVIFTRPTTPQDFFSGEKLIWYYTPYHLIQTPWQPITEKFLGGQNVEYEFMRRLPMMVPKWLYPRLREACHHMHGQIISDYVRSQPPRAFSEFNALGAFAWIYHKSKIQWVDTTGDHAMSEPCAKQFYSWSGITPEVKHEMETILGGGVSPALPSQIKVLNDDTWVLHGDQISGWVEQEGRLDHDQNLLPDILLHIKPGATVVDAGAFIGDHTLAYARAVGPRGMVYAFEPNPVAYQCLEHNMKGLPNVHCYQHGLGDKQELVPLSGNNGNAGGAYVGEHMKIGDVPMDTMDHSIPFGADFVKIDVEGYELKVLAGAEKIIKKCQPAMVIEINSGALERQGATPDQIFGWLTQHCYGWRILEQNVLRNDPLYNIIALPAVDKPGSAQVKAETPAPERIDVSASASTPSPQVSLTPSGVKDYVKTLKEFANENPQNKSLVSQSLVFAGLRKPNKKYGTNKTHKPSNRKRRTALKERQT